MATRLPLDQRTVRYHNSTLLNVGKKDLWAHKIAIKLPTNSTSTTRVNEYIRKQFQGISRVEAGYQAASDTYGGV